MTARAVGGRAGRGGAVERRRRERLAEMVRFARERAPYYRELYRGLPERQERPT